MGAVHTCIEVGQGKGDEANSKTGCCAGVVVMVVVGVVIAGNFVVVRVWVVFCGCWSRWCFVVAVVFVVLGVDVVGVIVGISPTFYLSFPSHFLPSHFLPSHFLPSHFRPWRS